MNEAILGKPSRSGSVTAMVVVSLMALLGIAALAIDIGLLYVAKQNAQNTADQCAVSALVAVNNYSNMDSELTQVNDEVQKIIAAYPSTTNGNGTRSASVAKFIGRGLTGGIYNPRKRPHSRWFSVDGEFQFNIAVEVNCRIPVDPTFIRVFGATRKTVQASAVARLYSVPQLEYPFAPWAVRLNTIFPPTGGGIPADDVSFVVPPTSFVTLTNPGGTAINQDGFTAIALPPPAVGYASQLQGPGGAVKLSTTLRPEPPATLTQPSYISTLPTQTNFSSDTSSALTSRFGVDASNDVAGKNAYSIWKMNGQNSSYTDSNRILIVPIVNDTAEADGIYKVRGFTPIFVLSYDATAGKIHFVLISATWTGGKLRWILKPKPGDTTSMVSKIALYDSDKTLTN